MKRILFIHGFASSGAYKLADILRILLKPCEVIAPDVPEDPAEALALLRNICDIEDPDLVVGLSWGGFLAQKLRGRRKALINPDFEISELLDGMIGEVRYLSPRRDGAESFIVTEGLRDAYRTIEKTQFEGLDDKERSLTLGFFADSDELVRCGDEFSFHYPGRAVQYPGKHLPTFPEVKKYIAPRFEIK